MIWLLTVCQPHCEGGDSIAVLAAAFAIAAVAWALSRPL